MPQEKLIIKVCRHDDCRARGGEAVQEALAGALQDGAIVEGTPDCFRFCKLGANVAVNGAVLHHVRPESAVSRVRRELGGSRAKKDVIGARPIDELDDVLDELSHL